MISEETRLKMRLAKLGKKQTKEHIENAARTRCGRKLSDETKKKIGDAHRNKIVSEETRLAISSSQMGRKPWNLGKTSDTDSRISKYWLGKNRDDGTKEKIRLKLLGSIPWNKGKKMTYVSHRFGTHHTKESLLKISAGKLGIPSPLKGTKMPHRSGKNHPQWKGGYENKLFLNNRRRVRKLGNGGSHTLKEWENMKEFYSFTCPCCFRNEPEIVLSRDHIIPLLHGGTDNIDNIQPLCRSCNSKKSTQIIKYSLDNS